ncbi:N-acetylglucosamine-6-phosphate deacetylase [Pradoshia sp.]
MTILIKNATIYLDDSTLHDGYILIDGETIKEIGPMQQAPEQADEVITVMTNEVVLPGFIDMHIHGAGGCDAMDGTEEAVAHMAECLPKEGTTSFLATTMTQSPENIEQALQAIHQYSQSGNIPGRADVIGTHLEGPFVNPSKAGAQPVQYIINPDIELFKKWYEVSGHTIKQVTFAPEEPGGKELVELLVQEGIIPSIGHTGATYQEATEAIALGASQATHLFNQMTGLHHRDIGAAGASLMNENIYAELIVDGIHVSPEMVNLSLKLKGVDRTILITDAMRAKGLSDGKYDLGGQDVFVKGKEARLEDGALAGSILKMNDALKNMVAFTGCSLRDAVQMAAVNPAKQLNIYDKKGSVAVGKDADLVILDQDYQVRTTICRGKIAYRGE